MAAEAIFSSYAFKACGSLDRGLCSLTVLLVKRHVDLEIKYLGEYVGIHDITGQLLIEQSRNEKTQRVGFFRG